VVKVILEFIIVVT